MSRRRVVITGMGVISPVGNHIDEVWKNVVAGVSGIALIERMDVSDFATRIGGEVRNFDPSRYLPPKEVRKTDAFIHYGVAAATDALNDSGLQITEANAARVGVAMGAGIGGIETIEKNYSAYLKAGSPRKISPFFVPGSIINMISGYVSILHGLTGPNLSTVSACTTATHNIGIGARMIQYGDADVILAGGAEMATTTLGLGGFCSARALSTRNDDPKAASRPWDRDRDGFVLSDGAAAMVIEEYEHARARGATIYAEIIGFGMSGDAHHITAPPEDGAGAALCMRNAMKDAGVPDEALHYINAHGTSTPVGDLAESRAIEATFGSLARTLPVSSTKSMTGHLLGAAGAIEALFCVLAIRDGVVPPTINLEHPGEGCNLDYVPNTARELNVEVALSNSFGFGGTNGTLVFGRA